jgi:tetratricopeptide (TPR) repeat protein
MENQAQESNVMKKKLPLILLAAMSLGTSYFIYSYIDQSKQKSHLSAAISAYDRGAKVESWVMIKDHEDSVLKLENGCELFLSVAMETAHFEEGSRAAQKCLELKKGVGIAHEVLAMTFVKEKKFEEAITLLKEELKFHSDPRIYASLARVSLLKEDREQAALAYLEAIKIASPWSPYLDRALSSTLSEDKKFLEKALELVMAKSEKAAPTERKLMALLWKNNLMAEGNRLKDRLGDEALPPLAQEDILKETNSPLQPSAGKLKLGENGQLPAGHPPIQR